MAGWPLAISAVLIYIIRWAGVAAGVHRVAMAVAPYIMGACVRTTAKFLALRGGAEKNMPKNLAGCLDFFNFV